MEVDLTVPQQRADDRERLGEAIDAVVVREAEGGVLPAFHPAPRPRISRPSDAASTVAAILASIAGAWKLVEATNGPSSIRSVDAASAASVVHTSHGPRGPDLELVEQMVAEPERVEAHLLREPCHRNEIPKGDLVLDLGQLHADLHRCRSAAVGVRDRQATVAAERLDVTRTPGGHW